MRQLARASSADRADVFALGAQQMGVSEIIIEKDFWVCWLLAQIWATPVLGQHLIFKGGTSLSKAYALIERFSEDIDLGVAHEPLGLAASHSPDEAGITRSQCNKRVEKLKLAARIWIEGEFQQTLSERVAAELGEAAQSGWSFELEPQSDGMTVLNWNPPTSERRAARPRALLNSYINPQVRLEIGARAAHWPAETRDVMPYVASVMPDSQHSMSASICVLEARRTFWEKATIFHHLNRESAARIVKDQAPKIGERLSRHLYDLHCLASSPHGEAALCDMDLLADVVKFKRRYFCSSAVTEAFYADAQPGTFELVPIAPLLEPLEADYREMQTSQMFFGTSASWPQIMETLRTVEDRINAPD